MFYLYNNCSKIISFSKCKLQLDPIFLLDIYSVLFIYFSKFLKINIWFYFIFKYNSSNYIIFCDENSSINLKQRKILQKE
jgi:hypothetical protein